MDHKTNYQMLLNSLGGITIRGVQNIKNMSAIIGFLEQCIAGCDNEQESNQTS